VVGVVARLEAAQDGDGVGDAGLADVDGLEATFEGLVLLDVLAVLLERGGADAAQLAAGQGGLEQVAGVHGAFGLAGADQRVELVDEENDAAIRVDHGLDDGLEALLELTAILGAGDQGAHVQRDELFVLKGLGDIAGQNPLGKSFHDGGLADAGRADEDGVVLGAAGQDLHAAADFVVAADHGVELAEAGRLDQVAAEAFERLVGILGVLAVHGGVAAHLLQSSEYVVLAGCVQPQDLLGIAGDVREREEQVLGRNVLILHAAGFAFGGAEHVDESAVGAERAAGLSGQAFELGVRHRADLCHVGAGLFEQGQDDAAVVASAVGQEGGQQV
jgi:hypothetical protein